MHAQSKIARGCTAIAPGFPAASIKWWGPECAHELVSALARLPHGLSLLGPRYRSVTPPCAATARPESRRGNLYALDFWFWRPGRSSWRLTHALAPSLRNASQGCGAPAACASYTLDGVQLETLVLHFSARQSAGPAPGLSTKFKKFPEI